MKKEEHFEGRKKLYYSPKPTVVVDNAAPIAPTATEPPIPLTYFDDCGTDPIKPWLIKNMMAKGETSTWIAPPGGGKSGLLTSAAIAAGSGADWYGFKTKERCGVVFFAFERGVLVERRLRAHRMRDGLENLPIAVGKKIVNLMDPRCVDLFLPTILAAEDRFGIGVGLVIVDTYNKGIAFGGGDEDKARDQNRALGNLRHLQERHADLHIAVIGHTGKDESRGNRGSNAMPGDADVQNQIRDQGGIKIVTTTKANDQPEGEVLRFKLGPYELGKDADGDPIEVWITANETIEVTAAGTTDKAARMTNGQRVALDALVNACTISAPASTELDFGAQVATMESWKAEMFRRGSLDKQAANPHRDFSRLREALQAKRLIAIDGNYVWPTNR
jgi:AAA domain